MLSSHKVGRKTKAHHHSWQDSNPRPFSSVRDKTQFRYSTYKYHTTVHPAVYNTTEKRAIIRVWNSGGGGGRSATAGPLPRLVSTSAVPFPLPVGSLLATFPAVVAVDTLCRPPPPHHAIYSNSNPPPTRYDGTFVVYVYTMIENNYRKSAPRPATLDTHGPLIGPYNPLLLGEYPLLIVIELP